MAIIDAQNKFEPGLRRSTISHFEVFGPEGARDFDKKFAGFGRQPKVLPAAAGLDKF
jgi:hypothetical protein